MSVRRQLFATRAFIIAFTIAVIVLTFYMLVSIQTKIIIIMHPTKTDYEWLYQSHADTLECLCSNPFIQYSDFIEIVPHFHQLCQSHLVSPAWYNNLAISSNETVALYYASWVFHAISYFTLLGRYCLLSENTFTDTYLTFYTKKFVSLNVVPEILFLPQIENDKNNFILSTKGKFRNSFSIMRLTTYVNQFVPASGSAIWFRLAEQKLSFLEATQSILDPSSPNSYSAICSCVSNAELCGFYGYFLDDQLQNGYTLTISLTIRCFPMDTALKSTLECWYNQTCSNVVLAQLYMFGISNNVNISILSTEATSRFPTDAYMESIVEEMLIEYWSHMISYDSYYRSCAPLSCSYKIQERFDLTVVILTILAVYSGLNKGLRLFIPILVGIGLFIIDKYRKRRNHVSVTMTTDMNATIQNPPRGILSRLYFRISQYNVFESSATDVETQHHQRISTRIYMVLLLGCVTILVLYTGIRQREETRSIVYPSQSEYESMKDDYSDSLTCPCMTSSIARSRFIPQLEFTLHPICFSPLKSESWFWYLTKNSLGESPDLRIKDFRKWSPAMFTLLREFCALANGTIFNAINQFLAVKTVSADVLPAAVFQKQMTAAIEQLRSELIDQYSSILKSIRIVSESNSYVSNLGYNWFPNFGDLGMGSRIVFNPVSYQNGTCSCATSSCLEPAQLLWYNDTILYTVPGFYSGCILLESLLRSSFACFFSEDCLTQFLQAITQGTDRNFWGDQIFPMSPLEFLPNQVIFYENDDVETIVNGLFIASWSHEISYEQYYEACKPLRCTYIHKQRLDVSYIFITLLSVFSGLSEMLRSLVPRMLLMMISIRDFLAAKVRTSRAVD